MNKIQKNKLKKDGSKSELNLLSMKCRIGSETDSLLKKKKQQKSQQKTPKRMTKLGNGARSRRRGNRVVSDDYLTKEKIAKHNEMIAKEDEISKMTTDVDSDSDSEDDSKSDSSDVHMTDKKLNKGHDGTVDAKVRSGENSSGNGGEVSGGNESSANNIRISDGVRVQISEADGDKEPVVNFKFRLGKRKKIKLNIEFDFCDCE